MTDLNIRRSYIGQIINRPTVTKPGDLVEIDTVHLVDHNTWTRKIHLHCY